MCEVIERYFPQITHGWVDYTCVPQDSADKQLLAINSLPYIVRQCTEFVVLAGESGVLNRKNEDEASYDVYHSRGWCRLECLSAAAPPSENEHRINTWLCNMNDHTVERFELSSNPSAHDPLAREAVYFDWNDKGKIAQTVMNLTEKFDSKTDGLSMVTRNAIQNLPADLKSKYSSMKK